MIATTQSLHRPMSRHSSRGAAQSLTNTTKNTTALANRGGSEMRATRTRALLGRVGILTAVILFTAAFVMASPTLATNAGNHDNGSDIHHANNGPGNDNVGDDDAGAPGTCAGLSGAAAGLCNAFCNAQNCPSHP